MTFNCSCYKFHETFVYLCKQHPYGQENNAGCTCKNRNAHYVCPFCCFVVHSLNFHTFKICLKKLPDFLYHRVTPIKNNFRTSNTDSFIWFNNEIVRADLDNSLYFIPAMTD